MVTNISKFSDKVVANEACPETANKQSVGQFSPLKSSIVLTKILRKTQAKT